MADSELEKLKKLGPQERLKKLKELSRKRHKEMSQIETLIKSSEKEIHIEFEDANEQPEQPRKASIDSVVSVESAEPASRQDGFTPQQGDSHYEALRQAHADYSNLREIAYAGMSGPLDQSHFEAIDQIGERLEKIKYHSASSEVANLAVASRSVLYKIKRYAGLE